MPGENKHVVFDVVGMPLQYEVYQDVSATWPLNPSIAGTCISYDNYFDAIEERLGDRFRAQNIGSRLFGYCWMEAGEREYTYLSLSGKYIKFFDIFRSIFYRTLLQAGIQEPREFASDDDLEFLLQSYRSLKARPSLAECWGKLRNASFTVWCLTAGDTARVGGYLKAGGVEMPEDNFVSCDTIGVGKPEPSSYKYILDKFDQKDLDVTSWNWTTNTTSDSEVHGARCGRRNSVQTSSVRWMLWQQICRRWQTVSSRLRRRSNPRLKISRSGRCRGYGTSSARRDLRIWLVLS